MELQAALKKFAAATNNQIFDPEYDGGSWMWDAEKTHETIDQFCASSQGWNERSKQLRGEVAGFPFVCWKTMQARNGDVRRSLSVIDFGDTRYAIDYDLTDFS